MQESEVSIYNKIEKCDVYVRLKPNFKMEKYLICLNKNQCIAICKFRTNNTRLLKITIMSRQSVYINDIGLNSEKLK